jgi:hypothetical protein
MNALTAVLISFLMPTLRSRRLIVCLARLIADLMIGMLLVYLFKFIIQSMVDYKGKMPDCKGEGWLLEFGIWQEMEYSYWNMANYNNANSQIGAYRTQ